MALLSIFEETNTLSARLEELEHRNQLLEAEVERLRVYKDYAYTDPLTEVPNRRFYYERLLQEVARARRGNHALALALVDLDYFKEINQQAGHRGGDQVLKFFAQFMRVNLRQEDVFCRIGGDEFAVILPETPANRATVLFERVKHKLDQVELRIDGRCNISVSFSCGIASFRNDFMPEDLIEEADHSLFTAKARGRRCVIASPAQPALVSRAVH